MVLFAIVSRAVAARPQVALIAAAALTGFGLRPASSLNVAHPGRQRPGAGRWPRSNSSCPIRRQLVSLGTVYHRFAYSYETPIRQVPWPMQRRRSAERRDLFLLRPPSGRHRRRAGRQRRSAGRRTRRAGCRLRGRRSRRFLAIRSSAARRIAGGDRARAPRGLRRRARRSVDLCAADQLDELVVRFELAELRRELLHRVDVVHASTACGGAS